MTHTVSELRLHRLDATHRTTWLIVEMLTDDGLVGVGECSDSSLVDDVPAAAEAAFDLMAGVDLESEWEILDERLWAWAAAATDPKVRFMRGTVVGGLMAAVCDVAAQLGGMPLWRWLGGEARSAVSCYANINRAAVHRRPDEFARLATDAVRDGFRMVKLAPFDGPRLSGLSLEETGVAHVRAVRQAVGDEVDVLVDVHGMLSRDELAEVLPALEEARVGWLEDAVDVSSEQEMAWLASQTSIPLAGGELIVDPEPLSAALASGHLSTLLLDPKYVGGPLRLRKLLELVEGVEVTYHNPTGPVATAMCAHLSTLHPEFALLEYAYGESVDRAGMIEPAEPRRGSELAVPMESGLGARLRPGSMPGVRTFGFRR